MNLFFVGVDLGQSRDYTAITIVERAELQGQWDPMVYARLKEVKLRLRFVERVPLGTPYPEIVRRVVEVSHACAVKGRCYVAVDGTGVGRPVVDLLREARVDGTLMPVLVTGGDTETKEHEYYRVPKRDLIIGLQVLLQQEGLQIAAKLPYRATLVQEMSDMQVKVTLAGNETYGAWREGTHDDLVFAVALACWSARKVSPSLEGDARYWRPYLEGGGG